MKNGIVSFFSILMCALSLSSFVIINEKQRNESTPDTHKKKKTWTKQVWSIIDVNDPVNNHIFRPYNDYFIGINPDTEDFNFNVLKEQKPNMKENLWNIIQYHFHTNEIKMFLPYNPDWAITKDHGHLLFEMSSERYGLTPNQNIETDSLFRENLKMFQVLGEEIFDPYVTAFTNVDGYDSVRTDENGSIVTVYPPNEFIWYQDKDIVQYKIKESWVINEQGVILRKTIDAIAPVKNDLDENGVIIDKRELFWIDFEELGNILGGYYIYDENDLTKKVYSFKDYFDHRKFSSTVVAQDSLHVR